MSPSRQADDRLRSPSRSWSTSCARPRRSRRRWPPVTGACSAAPRSRRRDGCGARSEGSLVGGERDTRADRRVRCRRLTTRVPRAARRHADPVDDELDTDDPAGGRALREWSDRLAAQPRRGRRRGSRARRRTRSSSARASRERSRSTTPTAPGGSSRCSVPSAATPRSRPSWWRGPSRTRTPPCWPAPTAHPGSRRTSCSARARVSYRWCRGWRAPREAPPRSSPEHLDRARHCQETCPKARSEQALYSA